MFTLTLLTKNTTHLRCVKLVLLAATNVYRSGNVKLVGYRLPLQFLS